MIAAVFVDFMVEWALTANNLVLVLLRGRLDSLALGQLTVGLAQRLISERGFKNAATMEWHLQAKLSAWEARISFMTRVLDSNFQIQTTCNFLQFTVELPIKLGAQILSSR